MSATVMHNLPARTSQDGSSLERRRARRPSPGPGTARCRPWSRMRCRTMTRQRVTASAAAPCGSAQMCAQRQYAPPRLSPVDALRLAGRSAAGGEPPIASAAHDSTTRRFLLQYQVSLRGRVAIRLCRRTRRFPPQAAALEAALVGITFRRRVRRHSPDLTVRTTGPRNTAGSSIVRRAFPRHLRQRAGRLPAFRQNPFPH